MTIVYEVVINYTEHTSILTYSIASVPITSFYFHDYQVDIGALAPIEIEKSECIESLLALIEWDRQIIRSFSSSLGQFAQSEYDMRIKKTFTGPPGNIRLVGKFDVGLSNLTDFDFKTTTNLGSFASRDATTLFFNDGWRGWINFYVEIVKELQRI